MCICMMIDREGFKSGLCVVRDPDVTGTLIFKHASPAFILAANTKQRHTPDLIPWATTHNIRVDVLMRKVCERCVCVCLLKDLKHIITYNTQHKKEGCKQYVYTV